MIGHAGTLILKSVISLNKLPKHTFIRSEKLNRLLGVGVCRWILANSFIKYFNPRLRISMNKPNLNELIELSKAMSYAEAVHLIGFIFVIVAVLMNIINAEPQAMIWPLLVVNILVNLYPALVQQLNKRRIDKLIMLPRYRKVRHQCA